MTESRPASHFKRLYEASPDPWGFKSSPYERAKYLRTIQALGDRRFASGLEVGCSIGILTSMLATRCDRLLGIDIVEEPLVDARVRCAGQGQVTFERMQVPAEWPSGRFDLMVFSEVLYFLASRDIELCARRVIETLLPGGLVVLVNWLGQTDDPNPAHAAPTHFIAASVGGLGVVRQEIYEHYRLDILGSNLEP